MIAERIIAVGAAPRQRGRTTLVVLLARAFAADGLRVAIVDLTANGGAGRLLGLPPTPTSDDAEPAERLSSEGIAVIAVPRRCYDAEYGDVKTPGPQLAAALAPFGGYDVALVDQDPLFQGWSAALGIAGWLLLPTDGIWRTVDGIFMLRSIGLRLPLPPRPCVVCHAIVYRRPAIRASREAAVAQVANRRGTAVAPSIPYDARLRRASGGALGPVSARTRAAYGDLARFLMALPEPDDTWSERRVLAIIAAAAAHLAREGADEGAPRTVIPETPG